jgi:uncharacterized protein (DUF362 family)
MQSVTVDFDTYADSIPKALDALNAAPLLAKQEKILVKPNLVNASPHPVTTHVNCCKAVINYVRLHSSARIVIAEGCGDASLNTYEVFASLGYEALARQYDIALLDLNVAPVSRHQRKDCKHWPEMYLPDIAFSHFIISLPVLKAHSLATITGSLKNMMGFAPPEYYQGRGGGWKKASFHHHLQQNIMELNRYRTPDLSVIDASIGLCDFHLGGRRCMPPVAKITAGFDPVAVDRTAAEFLGLDWQSIHHLRDPICDHLDAVPSG